MLFKNQVTLYIVVIVVGAVFLELAVFILAVFLVLCFIEVTELVRSAELFFLVVVFIDPLYYLNNKEFYAYTNQSHRNLR